MANRYYDYNNGSSGNDGSTPLLAKATRSEAVTASLAGDEVIAVDGIQIHESSHFTFNDDRIENAESFRGAILEANASETSRVARTSSGLSSANNPFLCKNLTFNGQSGSGGSVVQAFDIGADAGDTPTIQLHNCYFIAGSFYGLLITLRGGRVEIVNARITSLAGTDRCIESTTTLASDSNEVIDIQGLILDGVMTVSGGKGVGLTKVDNLTNTFEVGIKNLTGSMSVDTGASFTVVDINGCDAPIISGFDFTLSSDTASNCNGILCRGKATAIATDVQITSGVMNLLCPVGFGIALGESQVASNITGGIVAGVTVKGKHYVTATPHGISIGQGTTGEVVGCTSQDIYVGFLISKTTNGTVKGSLAFDCYGPSFYIKGATACTVIDNTAVVTSKHLQRDRGILAVTDQGGTNTVAATIQENLVIVTDISNIHSLAQIFNSSQACSFVRNTYIIPDTVDVLSEDLFAYESGGLNNTLAEWNAQAKVTDDVIVQMPLSEINTLVNSLRPDSGGGGGGGGFRLGLG